jgi:hypothetical protein
MLRTGRRLLDEAWKAAGTQRRQEEINLAYRISIKKNSINNDQTQWYQIPSLVGPMRSLYIVYLFIYLNI